MATVAQEAEPAAQSANGADDLGALISEFEASSAPRAEVPPPVDPQATGAPAGQDQISIEDLVDPRFHELREQAAYASREKAEAARVIEQARREVRAARDSADTERLVSEVKGDFPVDPEFVQTWIALQVKQSPAHMKVWENRENNPTQYQALCTQLRRGFAKTMAREPDPALTEDREAVVAAVRGASTNRIPEAAAPRFGHLNHNEYAAEVHRLYGFRPF